MAKQYPIFMSTPMVLAILPEYANQHFTSKGVTRRKINLPNYSPSLPHKQADQWVIKGFDVFDGKGDFEGTMRFKYGRPGDQLWVRETLFWSNHEGSWCYQADNAQVMLEDYSAPIMLKQTGTIPRIHMPREACRLILDIWSVRIERLQDITDESALREGILDDTTSQRFWDYVAQQWRDKWVLGKEFETYAFSPRDSFRTLWESINGPGSWDKNPYVWVIEFTREGELPF